MHPFSESVLNKTIGIFGADKRGNHMFDYRLCLAAMQLIQTQISTPNFSFLKRNNQAAFNAQTRSAYPPLDRTIGICGHHIQAFKALLQELNYQVRDVQIYHLLNDDDKIAHNHIIAEVFFGNAWRMFDVTWGWHPYIGTTENVLSFHQVFEGPYEKCMNMIDPWTNTGLRNHPEVVLAYLERQDFGVLYNAVGEISLSTKHKIEDGNILFSGLPRALGYSNTFDGSFGQTLWRIHFDRPGSYKVELFFHGMGWRNKESGSLPSRDVVNIRMGDQIHPFAQHIVFTVHEPNLLLEFAIDQEYEKYRPYLVWNKLLVKEI